MEMHNFTKSNFQPRAIASHPFELHGCDGFATFQQVNPGAFCQLPEGYEACHEGFRPYQFAANGRIIGVKLD